MSVTFAAEVTTTADTRVFAVKCDDGQTIGEYVGYTLAYGEAQAHSLVCGNDMCQGYGADLFEIFADGQPVPVNAANRNAQDILAVLGYTVIVDGDAELFGDSDADAFLGRVELALGLTPADEGLTEIVYQEDGGATFVDCARHAGYLQEKLADLRALALACKATHARIVWG